MEYPILGTIGLLSVRRHMSIHWPVACLLTPAPCAQAALEMLTAIGRGEFCARQAFTYLCRYVTEACRHAASRPLIAPFLPDILLHVFLRKCFFTAALQEQWQDDPMEVIRKNSTADLSLEADDFYDERDAAISAILDVMRIKALQKQLLGPLMTEVGSIAQAYRAQHGTLPSPCGQEHPRAAFGLYLLRRESTHVDESSRGERGGRLEGRCGAGLGRRQQHVVVHCDALKSTDSRACFGMCSGLTSDLGGHLWMTAVRSRWQLWITAVGAP